jgi:hypothetical protein
MPSMKITWQQGSQIFEINLPKTGLDRQIKRFYQQPQLGIGSIKRVTAPRKAWRVMSVSPRGEGEERAAGALKYAVPPVRLPFASLQWLPWLTRNGPELAKA